MMNAAQDLQNALADAVDLVAASVVRVEPARGRPVSGLVWSTAGLIVTSAHALDREETLSVALESGETRAATLVGADFASDIALLRVEGRALTTPERAPADALRRGHLVLALSRPGRTVRCNLGVVSALADEWRAPGGSKIERYIQSSVAIEAGFSGGPLIDVAGRLIGLNSAALLRSTPLSVPVSTIERVAVALLDRGSVERGYLGVSSVPARLPVSSEQRIGLLVTGVQPGGPAEQSGLLLGDVMLSLGGQQLENIGDLQAALEDQAARSAVLQILRAGAPKELTVTPSSRS
jgi:serine protease DegQ